MRYTDSSSPRRPQPMNNESNMSQLKRQNPRAQAEYDERRRIAEAQARESRRRENEMNNSRRAERRRKAKWLLVAFLLSLFAAMVCVISVFLASFFVIENINFVGDAPYSADEMTIAAELGYGDKLYRVDKEKVKELLLKKLPYLCEVEVELQLPDSVTITVKSEEAVMYTKTAMGYHALSLTLRVVENNTDPADFSSRGLIYVDLPDMSEMVTGQRIVLKGENKSDYISEFFNALKKSRLADRVSRIYLDERFNIVAVVDERYRVCFGSDRRAEDKLLAVSGIIDKEEKLRNEYAEINVNDPSTVGVIALESIDLTKKYE